MGSCDDVVDDGWAPKVEGRLAEVDVGTVRLGRVCMNGAFWALSSRTRCCNRSFSIFNSRNVFNIAVFLLGYVFAVAKKHLQVPSPSTKWGYPMISNSTSVALDAASGVLVEDAGGGTSGFVCILT